MTLAMTFKGSVNNSSFELIRMRNAFRREVPFDQDMLNEIVMFTLDVPISRSFVATGMTVFAKRFVWLAQRHKGLDGLQDEVSGETCVKF